MARKSLSGDNPWDPAAPKTLVIACSDGRFQEATDAFLRDRLRVARSDRLYVPGGPGALVSGGTGILRADAIRKECRFLAEAHGIADAVLIFHGPAKDGPPEACCGDYLHRFARFTPAQIRERQEKDAAELLSRGFGVELHLSAQVFFAEVEKDGDVRFVAWRAS